MAENINGNIIETSSKNYNELASNATTITRPDASTNIEHTVISGKPLQFEFSLKDVIVAQDGNDIILTFTDGGQITFTSMVDAAFGELPPILLFPNDQVLEVGDLVLNAGNIDDLAAELENLETAAGGDTAPGSNYRSGEYGEGNLGTYKQITDIPPLTDAAFYQGQDLPLPESNEPATVIGEIPPVTPAPINTIADSELTGTVSGSSGGSNNESGSNGGSNNESGSNGGSNNESGSSGGSNNESGSSGGSNNESGSNGGSNNESGSNGGSNNESGSNGGSNNESGSNGGSNNESGSNGGPDKTASDPIGGGGAVAPIMDVRNWDVSEDHNIGKDKWIQIATNIKTGDTSSDNDDTLSLTIKSNNGESLAGTTLYIYNISTGSYQQIGKYDSNTNTWSLDSDNLSHITHISGLSLPLFLLPAENSNVDLNLELTLTATDPNGGTKDTVENVKIGITSVADNAAVDFGAQTGARVNILGETIDKSNNINGETIYGGGGGDNIKGGSANDIIYGDSYARYEVSIDIKQILTDNDGSETIALRISGDNIPTGATVVGGVEQADGSWTIVLAKSQTELKLELNGNDEKSFDIKVQTMTIDHDNDTGEKTLGSWSSEQTVTVDVNARTKDGDDTIDGGAGDDTIYGEGGDDQLWGGTGNDTFVFNKDSGNDTINDFEIGKDKISIGNHDAIGVAQSGDDIIITFRDDKGDTTGDTVTIKDVTIDDGADNKFSFDEVKDLFKDIDSSNFIPE